MQYRANVRASTAGELRETPYALSDREWRATRSPKGRRVAEREGLSAKEFEPCINLDFKRVYLPSGMSLVTVANRFR
jgi:hypothetical protein